MAPHWITRLRRRGRQPRIYLHIGAMKTGTTYLQALMSANRAELAAAGYLFPGRRWSDQSSAVRDILFQHTDDPRLQARTRGKWDALCQEARAHQGTASIVSMEFLSFADDERAATVVESLAGLDVHVVLTVRDAQTAIPAQWQTSCRNGGRVPYHKFVRGARYVLNGQHAPRGRASHLFQRTQGIPRMLDTWVPLVGADHVHVITVPPRGSDPSLLWRRFAQVIGVRADVLTTREVADNPSLGHASSELLRQVNGRLGKVSAVDYWKIVKGQLARTILGQRTADEDPVRLNARGLRLARRWNRTVRRSILEHDVQVVGSLGDLPVGPPDQDAPDKLPGPDPRRCWPPRTRDSRGCSTCAPASFGAPRACPTSRLRTPLQRTGTRPMTPWRPPSRP